MTISRRVRRSIIFLIVTSLIAFLVYKAGQKEPVLVVLAKADRGDVAATVANTRAGTIKACRRANLTPAGGGQVAKLYVKEGSHVEQGDLLLELWNDDLQAQLTLAEREAAASKQTVTEACLMADAAGRDAKRIVKLSEGKLASEGDKDTAVTNSKARQAACLGAKARAEVSETRIAVAQATLERTRLRAPFAGFVAEVNGEVGEYVTPSPPGIPTPPAIDLVDTSCLYVLAPIDEVDAPQIVPGMETRITLDAFPDQVFLGAVRRIAPYVQELEKQARTVDIEAVFMDEAQYAQLIPGYSADVEVVLDERFDVLRIPTEAIMEGRKVYVFTRSTGVIKEQKIESGLSNWKFTEVTSGLKAGDEVVLSIDRVGVKDGATVQEETDKESK